MRGVQTTPDASGEAGATGAPHSAEWGKSACALGVSCVVHLMAALLLSVVFLDGPRQVVANLISTLRTDELAEIDPAVSSEVFNIEETPTNTNSDQRGIRAETAPTLGISNVQSVSLPLEMQSTSSAPEIRLQQAMVVPQEAPLVALLTTTGSAVTENRGGTVGAIDRITREIAASLKENRTQVMWLFDASLSLKRRREEIADHFERVYQ